MPASRLAVLCLAIPVILAGCDTTPRSGRSPAVREAITWPYAPASIRVHPISRIKIDPETGQAHVKAHIEFLDIDGFSTRGIGRLEFVLSGQGDGSTVSISKTTWECDLNNPDTNSEYFDEVTRAYLATLELSPGVDVPWDPRFKATLVLPDGSRLSDTSTIRFMKPAAEPESPVDTPGEGENDEDDDEA